MYNNIYLTVVLIAALSSLKAFRLDMGKPYKCFSLYLFFVLLIEICAVSWPRLVKHYHLDYSPENHWVYNLYLIPAYLFYLYFYYNNLKSVQVKKLIKVSSAVLLLAGLYNLLLAQGVFKLNTYTLVFAGLLVVCLTLTYFYQILNEKIFVPLMTNPLFWISAGAFLFHLTTMLGLFFIVFLNDWYGRAAYASAVIIKITSIIMYTTYSIAFLCQKKAL
jgi:hypothetical protein